MKQFIFPHCRKWEKDIGKIQGISRLFAYPSKPHFENNGSITILDSGAFGLSNYGGKITNAYMKKLSNHYNTYCNDSVHCVAPDMWGNPLQSMYNLKKWYDMKLHMKNLAAVLQMNGKNNFNLQDLKNQVDFYINFTDIIYFSTGDGWGIELLNSGINKLTLYMKEKGVKYIHILGCGYNIQDIYDCLMIQNINSIDTICYYLKAKNKQDCFDIINKTLDIVKDINNDNYKFIKDPYRFKGWWD